MRRIITGTECDESFLFGNGCKSYAVRYPSLSLVLLLHHLYAQTLGWEIGDSGSWEKEGRRGCGWGSIDTPRFARRVKTPAMASRPSSTPPTDEHPSATMESTRLCHLQECRSDPPVAREQFWPPCNGVSSDQRMPMRLQSMTSKAI